MKLVSNHDFAAPIAQVFAALTDFAAFERMVRDKGVLLRRADPMAEPGVGSTWETRFFLRGREVQATSRITTYEPPALFVIDGHSGGYEFSVGASLLALAREQTRLRVDLEVKPRTLGARIVMQTMKLGKPRLQSRFSARIGTFADHLRRQMVLARKPGG